MASGGPEQRPGEERATDVVVPGRRETRAQADQRLRRPGGRRRIVGGAGLRQGSRRRSGAGERKDGRAARQQRRRIRRPRRRPAARRRGATAIRRQLGKLGVVHRRGDGRQTRAPDWSSASPSS